MRDPDGHIIFEDKFVLRYLNEPAGPDHFLRSSLARRWVERGLLIPYEWINASTLRSPRLPFVTLPPEWTSLQFFVAAKFTLDLHLEAVNEGWDLKDASAWNIVFNGLKPVFVDLLSFVPLRERLWRAAGQFTRHFVFPLLLDKKNYIEPRQCMKLWRDGVTPKTARRYMGPRRFFTRYWPLMVEGRGGDESAAKITEKKRPQTGEIVKKFRYRLQSSLLWMLNGVNPGSRKDSSSIWANYEINRPHYSEGAIIFKHDIISGWLGKIRPEWVLDVGCNAGEFSDLAVRVGAKAICWDGDSQALLNLHRRHISAKTETNYFPVCCPIDDATAGCGWMGNEFPSLTDRLHGRVDVVMLLAIIHHLVIAGGVRLEDIFRFAAHVTRRAVLLELVSENDARILELCRHYNRNPLEFTIERQYAAATAAGFRCIDHAKRTACDTREYVWLEHGVIS